MDAFKLGPFWVEPSKGSIFDGEKYVTIEPKAMAVLSELNANQSKVVSQQDLFYLVWPNRVFSPSSIQRTIAIIRKALNENSQNPTYLFTHPKLGYRLENPNKQVPEVQGYAAIEDKTSNETSLKAILIFTGFILVFMTLWFPINIFNSQKPSSTIKPMTFGQHAEFNSKISGNGKLLAYQSESNASHLFVSPVDDSSNIRQIAFTHSVVDFVWRGGALLVITQTTEQLFSIHQLDLENPKNNTLVTELSQWNFISNLVLSDNSSLWFVGQPANEDTYFLTRLDLVSNVTSQLMSLPSPLINVDISWSPQGLYFHYFDGKGASFGLVTKGGEIQFFDLKGPEIVDIHWYQNSNSLLLSNLMTPALYSYSEGYISEIDLPLKEVLSDISSYQSSIVATQTRTDMDIVRWRVGGQSKLVDSKYGDYQATLNSVQDMAFLSSRNGRPQIFIRSGEQTKLIYNNPENIQFFPPLVWSPNNDKLAFVANNKLHLLNTKTDHIDKIATKSDVERVMSWPINNKLTLKHSDASFTEFDLSTQQSVPLLLQNPRSKNTALKDLIFATNDADGTLLGIDKEGLFWGELRKPFSDEVLYSFYQDDHLIIHSYTSSHSSLNVFNDKLELVLSTMLDSECLHLTGIDLSNLNNITWLCTKLEADDSEIILIEGLSLQFKKVLINTTA